MFSNKGVAPNFVVNKMCYIMKKVIKKGGFLRDYFRGDTPIPEEKDTFSALLFFLGLMLSLPVITLLLFLAIEWI